MPKVPTMLQETDRAESARQHAAGTSAWHGVWLLFALVILAASRFFALTADPPSDMILHYLSDEGWWAHTAREHAVFGQWIMDDHTPSLYWIPLYTFALRGVYAVLGWGLWQTRALTALSGIATCLFVYGFLRVSHGARAAFFSALLLATNFLWFSYNRVAFVETFQTALITAAFLAVAAASRRSAWSIAAGILFMLAVLAKISHWRGRCARRLLGVGSAIPASVRFPHERSTPYPQDGLALLQLGRDGRGGRWARLYLAQSRHPIGQFQ